MAADRGRTRRVSVPGVAELLRPATPLPAETDEREATGREPHDLEHARLKLRRFGFVLDRGRLVREAIVILLADLDARGEDSLVARRIRSTQDRQGKDEDAVLSLTWLQR